MEQAISSRLARWVTAEPDWDAVYAEELPRVYNFFRYRFGPSADAEDLTARTFEKAWQARHRYRRDLGAFTTWLFTIARRVGVDHWRQRRAHLPLEAAAEVAGGAGADADAERRSDLARLGALLARHDGRARELIALKYGAELTNREIARQTGLSETNVGTILHRTVQALRAEWQEGA